MKVLTYIRKKGLKSLLDKYHIKATYHRELPLVILNYSIFSPIEKQIVREYRGLTLELDSWKVCARGFSRFLNLGERPTISNKFNWEDFKTYSKEDGSLILLYNYLGEWRVNTRGSFAEGNIQNSDLSWKDYFWGTVDKFFLENLQNNHTYLFELCGPYNRIVTKYEKPQSFILAGINNETGEELPNHRLACLAFDANCSTPKRTEKWTKELLLQDLTSQSKDFEGYVVKDNKGMRLKVKNPAWLSEFHLKGNNGANLNKVETVVDILINRPNDFDEVISYYPEYAVRATTIKNLYESILSSCVKRYEEIKSTANQKDFALLALKAPVPSVLFNARKNKISIDEAWKLSQSAIVKNLEIHLCSKTSKESISI